VSAKGARARFRLPTEAEWEHACRAGSTAAYPWGDGFEEAYAWCWINSEGRPHPAGLRRPNAWGLFDTLGNAAEWCADWHAPHPAGDAVDPSGPQTGTARVVRGGSWKDLKGQLKPALRRSLPPGQFDKETGFRLAMDP
jgi:formylglycine-generating enzyme required for sulfatase activity